MNHYIREELTLLQRGQCRTSTCKKTGPGEKTSPLYSNNSEPKLLRGGDATFGSATWKRGLAAGHVSR